MSMKIVNSSQYLLTKSISTK